MKVDSTVPMPARIARLPKHKGLPVPAMVLVDNDGVAHFTVMDRRKWWELARARACGICGQRLGQRIWFVGGPQSIEHRAFTDLPMHEDCAEYALAVCPFLALVRFKFIQSEVVIEGHTIDINESLSTVRPERFGMAASAGYRAVRVGNDDDPIVLRADPFSEVRWWRHGKRIA